MRAGLPFKVCSEDAQSIAGGGELSDKETRLARQRRDIRLPWPPPVNGRWDNRRRAELWRRILSVPRLLGPVGRGSGTADEPDRNGKCESEEAKQAQLQ